MRIATLVALACMSFAAAAQDYPSPSRPVRLISPYPAGGSNDLTTRLVAQKLAERWGRQVIAENRVGAQNRLATEQVARSPADGYTLLMVAAPHGANPALYDALPYDTVRDFTPVVWVVTAPIGYFVNAAAPWKTMQGLLAYARANPGKLSVGTPGNASAPHLTLELLKHHAKIDVLHVPMKGDAPLVTEVLGGRIDIASTGLAGVRGNWTTGKMRALGVANATRAPGLENVTTLAEIGLPAVVGFAWFGIVGPAGLPAPVVERINAEVNAIIRLADVRERFDALGLIAEGGTPQKFATHIAEDVKKWTTLAKTVKLQAE